MDIQSSLFFKNMRNLNAQLVHFSYLFQEVADYGLGCDKRYFHRFSWSIFIEVWWIFRFAFISQWYTVRMNLWKQVLNSAVGNDILARNTIFFVVSVAFLLFSNSNITCQIALSVPLFWGQEIRLNYDTQYFTIERKTNEGTF